MYEKKGYQRKEYCNANTCTGCSSINVVRSGLRWCYEEKFSLRRQDYRIRYQKDGIEYNVFTGVIEHQTLDGGNNDGSHKTEWEKNFMPVSFDKPDPYRHLIQETCKTVGVDYNKFMRTMKKIMDEMEIFNDAES